MAMPVSASGSSRDFCLTSRDSLNDQSPPRHGRTTPPAMLREALLWGNGSGEQAVPKEVCDVPRRLQRDTAVKVHIPILPHDEKRAEREVWVQFLALVVLWCVAEMKGFGRISYYVSRQHGNCGMSAEGWSLSMCAHGEIALAR